MTTLICCNSIGFSNLRETHKPFARNLHRAQAAKPIRVQVRVRQYGDMIPEVRQVRSSSPDLGRLPVGSILDCYV